MHDGELALADGLDELVLVVHDGLWLWGWLGHRTTWCELLPAARLRSLRATARVLGVRHASNHRARGAAGVKASGKPKMCCT